MGNGVFLNSCFDYLSLFMKALKYISIVVIALSLIDSLCICQKHGSRFLIFAYL
ncbi:hypothetical protein LSO9J_90039 [Candidatus Liberibacter solanacearum]